jgi:hypothetical protein
MKTEKDVRAALLGPNHARLEPTEQIREPLLA